MNKKGAEYQNNSQQEKTRTTHGVVFKDPKVYGQRKKIEIVHSIDKAYLEQTYQKMAKKGWLIDRVKGVRQTYRPIEPCDLVFSVAYFQPTRLMEYPTQTKSLTYQQFIKDSGWTYVDNNDVYHVFYKSEGSDIPAIYTEPKEDYATIIKAMKRSEFMVYPLLVLSMIYLLWLGLSGFSYKDLYRNAGLSSIVYPTVTLLAIILPVASSLLWIVRNRKRAREGEPLVYTSMEMTQWKNRLYYGITVIVLLYLVISTAGLVIGSQSKFVMIVVATLIIPIVIGAGIGYKIKHVESKRSTNILMTIGGLLIAYIVTVGIVFIGIGSSLGNRSETMEPYSLPKGIPILSHEDLGTDLPLTPYVINEGHTLLAPQSLEYRSVHYKTDALYARIEMTYVRTIAPWYAKIIVDRVVHEEEKEVQEEFDYIDKYMLTTDTSYLDYVQPLDVDDYTIDLGYNLSKSQDKIVLLKGNELCIIRLDEAIDSEILDNIVEGLGW